MKIDLLRAPLPALPAQSISVDVLREKYFKNDEQHVDEVFRRVARALASVEAPAEREHYENMFFRHQQAGGIGAGRIMSAAGTALEATLINCFVQPVGDAIQGRDDEGYPGIYEALREAAETMRRGGGVGYDFSRIRPSGAHVKTTASVASGPCSYMNVFDQSCNTVESAGSRRGAQMGVLRIDHPDVMEFVTAKRTPGRWNNFNVSIAVSDRFMQAVRDDGPWQLVHKAAPGAALIAAGAHPGDDGHWVYATLRARDLWDTVMQSAYDFAEPGILFIDNINRDNNLGYCERIDATNPCGEQPLPSYGCCDLGPLILPRFVHHPFGIDGTPAFDFEAFERAVAVQVRALDNVLDLTFWPLPEQRAEAQLKRRIGVGFTGLGSALIMLRLRYDRPEGRAFAVRIAETMRDAAYRASIGLAREKGAFAAFDAKGYLRAGSFASRLPEELQDEIRTHGMRNSHLLSIAPTGTVSLAFADNASNGIEPPFSWSYRRKKREADGTTKDYVVEEHAWRLYKALVNAEADASKDRPDYFVSALEMSADAHLAMMEAVQPYVDTAISKTVNIPQNYPYSEFKDLYWDAWQAQLKGLATYRPNSILGAVLETSKEAGTVEAATVAGADPMREVISSRPKGGLTAVAEKLEYWTQDGHHTLYLIVSFLPVAGAKDAPHHRAIEFFMPVGQSGQSQQWISASMRLLSLAARGGFLERGLSDMRKVAWDRGPVRLGTYEKDDGALVPRWHDSEVAAIGFAIQNIISKHRESGVDPSPKTSLVALEEGLIDPASLISGKKCSECGAYAMIRKDGCDYCTNCGYLGTCG